MPVFKSKYAYRDPGAGQRDPIRVDRGAFTLEAERWRFLDKLGTKFHRIKRFVDLDRLVAIRIEGK